ncbi:hypothetical protein F4808DRAFT_51558 [Astrocystis sublimbata]|nr:hypothetical protein F4808DRAFT_51558 [Astrocystis sublimbata]
MSMNSTIGELRGQWANPSDILSLLLLIGGDIVQKAIAQLVGYRIRLPGGTSRTVSVAPVAFSFGWVAYAFLSLLSAIGEMRLMPASDYPCLMVNCSNGFIRESNSWVLGRLLRDHENAYPVDPRPVEDGGRAESLRIDIFHLQPPTGPDRDFGWWSGWIVMAGQIVIALVPWVCFGDWGVLLVTLAGSVFAMITCAVPQWTEEKWAGRKLRREKVTCLTRGNGHRHVMVFIGGPGAWDLESLATGASDPRPETRWLFGVLAILWTLLLITVSGLKEHTWFLVGIGGVGMLQNAFVAGASRDPGASDLHTIAFPRASTIIGQRQKDNQKDDPDTDESLQTTLRELADVELWATEQPVSSHGSTQTTAGSQARPMPRWLDTMAVEDGLPAWLELVELGANGSTSSGPLPGSRPAGGDGMWRRATSDTGKRKVIVYAEGVHGALMGLEKWVPTAGLVMVQIFFPAGLTYNEASIRDSKHKKFWRRAYHTKSARKRAEEKRRAEASQSQVLHSV